MKKFVAPLTFVTIAGVLANAGCQHACQKPCPPAPPPGFSGPVFFVPPVDRSIPSRPVFPQPVLQTPVAPAGGAEARGYAPPLAVPAQPSWGPPANGGARLLAPEINTPEPPISSSKPMPAEVKPQTPPRLERNEQSSVSPALPVDIPGFASAKEQVASGQKPLAGGFDWLKANGYNAVLYIREPGEDDAVDKRDAEERGLKYFSLEVSPKTLGKRIVDEFNRIVGEAGNRPLFVYDRDGVLAGGLWYLHFRTAERQGDEAARIKAAALGLKTDKGNANPAMWLAIQKYLSEQAP